MHWALVSIKRDHRFGLIVGLFLTLAIGLTFLSLQIHEYLNLGFTPSNASPRVSSRSPASTACTSSSARRCSPSPSSAPGGATYSGAEHIGLEVTGLYWHFVDVVWILLYTVVYLL